MAGNGKRLIDANWILGEIEHDVGCYEIEKLTPDDSLYVELRDVVKLVCAAQTVDAVEVVHGRWLEHDMSGIKVKGFMACSNCNVMIPTPEGNHYCLPELHYCPNCGAKMDGDGDG